MIINCYNCGGIVNLNGVYSAHGNELYPKILNKKYRKFLCNGYLFTCSECLAKFNAISQQITRDTRKYRLSDVINRLYNCKFESAYEQAQRCSRVPKKIIPLFKKASDDFGNCGWGGKAIQNTAENLADNLGYVYDKKEDYFIKRKK